MATQTEAEMVPVISRGSLRGAVDHVRTSDWDSKGRASLAPGKLRPGIDIGLEGSEGSGVGVAFW